MIHKVFKIPKSAELAIITICDDMFVEWNYFIITDYEDINVIFCIMVPLGYEYKYHDGPCHIEFINAS